MRLTREQLDAMPVGSYAVVGHLSYEKLATQIDWVADASLLTSADLANMEITSYGWEGKS